MRRAAIAVAALGVAGAAVPGLDRLAAGQRRREAQAVFQQATGGLGLGASTVPRWDFSSFDPRLEPRCACALWPLPGAFAFSPEHGTTVWGDPEPVP